MSFLSVVTYKGLGEGGFLEEIIRVVEEIKITSGTLNNSGVPKSEC
jgi:hypothetical protein